MDGNSADWIIQKSKRKKDIYKISFMESKGLMDCVKKALKFQKLISQEMKKIKVLYRSIGQIGVISRISDIQTMDNA